MTTHSVPPALAMGRWLALGLAAWLAGCATVSGPQAEAEPAPVAVAAPAESTPAAAPAASAVAALPPASDDERFVATPVDPMQPDRPVDLYDDRAKVDLWERVRAGFAMPDLDSDLVRDRERWYASRPDYVQRMTQRGSRYLFHVVEELDKRGMPMELALLPFIESAFNPQAQSVAKASGMWQFIPSTGKDYDLTQNVFRDDRRNVLASTRAALDYLGRLHRMFGDWHLALAAYNWGEGNVQRAIARNQKAGLPTDYESLRMPAETRYYVPKLQAVKNIVARPSEFALSLPELKNHPYFLSVPIERDIDVSMAVHLAEVPLEEFRHLNPQMNKPVILAAGTEQILLPYDNANRFVQNLARHKGPLATWTAWVTPRTMRPADAARQVGMSEEALREVNRIPPRMVVKAGSTLLVPRTARHEEDVSEELADHAMIALAPDAPALRRLTLRAGKKGETVASVAKRYNVSARQVAQWNDTSASGRFKPGASIVVYKPARKAGTTVASRGAKSTRVAATGAKTSSSRKAASKAPSQASRTKVATATRGGSASRPASRPVSRASASPKAAPVRMTRQ